MAVEKVSDATFENEVLKASGPVVVDFWAEWCGPCRMIAPALDEISSALGDKVKIVKLNVDESPNTAAKYGIMSIPTLMIFKNGEMASRQVAILENHQRRDRHDAVFRGGVRAFIDVELDDLDLVAEGA